MPAEVNHDRCVGCELCARSCGVTKAITLDNDNNWVEVDESLCWDCGACAKICPFSAITLPFWAAPDKTLREAIVARKKDREVVRA